MPREIAAATLAHLLETGSTLALIDVREHGEYNLAHIPGASSVPRRQLEARMGRLVPFRGAQVVVCDDNGRRAALAAATLARMGYTRVAVLEGGVNRWASLDRPTEWGMNVPSKDFGEKVEVQHHVPTIDADELARRQRRGDELVILDTRTPEEYRRFCIPGGRSAPGGELALRIHDIVSERPGATVVVNCAGRTRSIIGARVLQRMALPNVVSLRNGTSGWLLAGLELERGAGRVDLPAPSAEGRARAEAFARRVAAEDGVRMLAVSELEALKARASTETVYLVDVRTREEYEAGHIPGFSWFPGGQAVQRADDTVAVRNGAVVFCCDGIARAAVTASWYRQMGFPNVHAVTGGTAAWAAAGRPLAAGADEMIEPLVAEAGQRAPRVSAAELASSLASGRPPLVLCVEASDRFAAGHIPGARWLSRSWLELRIGELAEDPATPIVATDDDGHEAPLAAAALLEMGYVNAAALAGGAAAWQREGRPLEQGLTGVLRPPDDVVPAGPDRGTADMINYLRWEERLGHKYSPAAEPHSGAAS
ncbi:MAG TPA: rhodanese-like domain-containing protein [Candidatus Methylomirabilis sp.]|nr:rhodanese-like domain-containing protein [Candidatus Methylomirabilis sp.]